MIIRTFLEASDTFGLTIYPFVTYAVSGLGNIQSNYARLCPTANLGEALAVQGDVAADAAPLVEDWLGRIGIS